MQLPVGHANIDWRTGIKSAIELLILVPLTVILLTVSVPEVRALPAACGDALQQARKLTADAPAIAAALELEIAKLANPAWVPGYCRAVSDNFASKTTSQQEGVIFTTSRLIATAIAFEAFRIAAFRNSGVAPLRYFGFLDEQGRTATYEAKLRTTATRVASIIDRYVEKHSLAVSVTPQEIVVTHLAEGGALLLTRDFYLADRVHPVSGIGLDDYRRGLKQYGDLVAEIDAEFSSKLAAIASNPERPGANAVLGEGPVRRFERYLGIVSMTFEETVLATAVMYLWEKVITDERRRTAGRQSLRDLPLGEQFVHSSLVYNSGILFSDERVKQMMAFDTAAYLAEISEKSAPKRPKLPVMTAAEADALLVRGEKLPMQSTSWNAVYHCLQRYGAWVGLTRFSDVFTSEGKFR